MIVQDCGTVATTPATAPAAATLLAAAQVAPCNPMYNPLYGMRAPGTGYKYRQHNTRADHHAFLHTFRTFVQFLDQSCPFSPGTATAARRTRLTRYTWAWFLVAQCGSRVCRIRARNPRFPPTEVDARSSSCVVHVFEGSCTESCPCVNRDNDQCPGVCPTRARPPPASPRRERRVRDDAVSA